MPKERQTCTECSMRRQKCDRNLPCSRCIKRGEPDRCTREWPKEGYDPRKHRVYPRPDGKDEQSSPSTSAGNEDVTGSPLSAAQQSNNIVHPALRATEFPPAPKSATSLAKAGSGLADKHRDLNTNNGSEKNSEVLEFLTWGRGSLSDYQVKSFDLLKEPFKNNQRAPCPQQ